MSSGRRPLRRPVVSQYTIIGFALLFIIAVSTVKLNLHAISVGTVQLNPLINDAPLPLDESSKKQGRPLLFNVKDLKNIELAHGTFYFGPHSQEADIDHNYNPSLNSIQMELLDDDEHIDIEKEKERCARYGLEILNQTEPKRRRLFAGWLISDDSMEVLKAVSTESYNIYHTVSYVEAFKAHNLSPRTMNYYDPGDQPSGNLNTLLQLFGPKTKVSVDYYNTTMNEVYAAGEPFHSELFMDYVQREGNTYRWALNGMRHDDIGIIGDADEVFTRDFLRAMQICDVEEFRVKERGCANACVTASTLVFESSPECLTNGRRWFHPNAVLGECVVNVGDSTLHPPVLREFSKNESDLTKDQHGLRMQQGSDSLWHGTDIRLLYAGGTYSMADGSATAYHFHNYFKNAEEIHLKYATYGHAKGDRAFNMPIWSLADDIQVGVDCVNNIGDRSLSFNNTGSSVLPIYYMNDINRNRRHEQWHSIVKGEEDYWQKKIDGMQDLENEGVSCWLDCGDRAGFCPFFCGKKGLCCSSFAWDPNNQPPECLNGTIGCDNGQCCVATKE
jgi:hypothetical protein